jgi:hypothetical protein
VPTAISLAGWDRSRALAVEDDPKDYLLLAGQGRRRGATAMFALAFTPQAQESVDNH